MTNQTLHFAVKGSSIRAMEDFVSADSVQFTEAEFDFDESWDELLKTAIFRKGERVYHVVLTGGCCDIPQEVLTDGILYVSAFGVSDNVRATTVETTVQVEKSGYTLCEPITPYLDPYNHFLNSVSKLEGECETHLENVKSNTAKAEELCKTAEANCADTKIFSDMAEEAKLKAESAAANAENYCEQVIIKADEADTSANKAEAYSELTYDYLKSATNIAMKTVETHNKDNSGAHSDIMNIATEAKNIALGKANSLTFNTEFEMKSWLGSNNLCPLPPEGTFSDSSGNVYIISCNSDGTFNLNAEGVKEPVLIMCISVEAGTYTVSTNSKMIKIYENTELPCTLTRQKYETINLCIDTSETSVEENIYIQIERGTEVTEFEPPAGFYTRPDGKTKDDLKVGDNLYIVETGVPDYWWDGNKPQPLGAEKPDLSDYYTKAQIDLKIGDLALRQLSQSVYDEMYNNGTLEGGIIYFVYEG